MKLHDLLICCACTSYNIFAGPCLVIRCIERCFPVILRAHCSNNLANDEDERNQLLKLILKAEGKKLWDFSKQVRGVCFISGLWYTQMTLALQGFRVEKANKHRALCVRPLV